MKQARRKKAGDEIEEPTGWANVIALDPGGTTGWSVFMVHPDAIKDPDIPILANVEHWAHGQFTGDEDYQSKHILELVEAWHDAVVVIEQFKLRQMAVDLSPVSITAKVEFGLKFWPGLGGNRSSIKVFKQMPALAKTTVTDARLKEWGYYEREGGMEHARDADRHALTFYRRCKEQQRLAKMAWPEFYGLEGPSDNKTRRTAA